MGRIFISPVLVIIFFITITHRFLIRFFPWIFFILPMNAVRLFELVIVEDMDR